MLRSEHVQLWTGYSPSTAARRVRLGHTCAMPTKLDLRQLRPEDRYASPYDTSVPGYLHDTWWTDLDFALNDPKANLLVIADERGEVARALVLEHRIVTQFREFDGSIPTIEIDKFEVRRHLWKNGYGRDAVELIRRRWASFQTVAFSLDADHFWEGIGFKEKRRRDDASGYKTFFIAPSLDQ